MCLKMATCPSLGTACYHPIHMVFLPIQHKPHIARFLPWLVAYGTLLLSMALLTPSNMGLYRAFSASTILGSLVLQGLLGLELPSGGTPLDIFVFAGMSITAAALTWPFLFSIRPLVSAVAALAVTVFPILLTLTPWWDGEIILFALAPYLPAYWGIIVLQHFWRKFLRKGAVLSTAVLAIVSSSLLRQVTLLRFSLTNVSEIGLLLVDLALITMTLLFSLWQVLVVIRRSRSSPLEA